MASMPYAKTACVFLLGCVLCLTPALGFAQNLGKLKPKVAAPKEDKSPANLAPKEVDAYLAGLTDQQVRRLYAEDLKKGAESRSAKAARSQFKGKESGIVVGFFSVEESLKALLGRLDESLSGAFTPTESEVWERLVGGKGTERFLGAMGSLVFIILLGWAAERAVLRATGGFRGRLLRGAPLRGWEKTGAFLSGFILDCLGICVYALTTFVAHFVLYGQGHGATLVSSTVVLSYYFRIIRLIAQIVTSPSDPALRLVTMTDSDARFLYRWFACIALSVFPTSIVALALQKAGAARELYLLAYSTAGPVVSILVSAMIWQGRRRVGLAICPEDGPESDGTGSFRRQFAACWHWPAILFVLGAGGYWWSKELLYGDARITGLIMSIFVVPVCVGLDQWLQQLLGRLEAKPPEVIDLTPPEPPERVVETDSETSPEEEAFVLPEKAKERDLSLFVPLIRKSCRVVLALFLFFAILELWDIDFDYGWLFAKSVLGIVIGLVLGLIVWEIAKAAIDRRIEEEMPIQGEEVEDGGKGGSRSGTLLLLLRKFIMVFLFLVIGFSVLATLGVNIAPLLAGAGVVGLAIGFGSQTLVKDIIAGIFFLVDDAFRVGDYVEAGSAKGTVEQISLRSLRLRHPRGQIFVVPFGDLKMVQNFTRDYNIEKIDIRVRFDADINVIRKIVKKINKEIKEDEEMAKVLLSDIKSMGVRAMDDSAMIMRVKFMCKPGEQYVIRREVFHRIQKAFKEKGIEFAHRNVTVYLPPQQSGGTGQAMLMEAAGAAAAAVVQAEEEAALAKAQEKKKTG